MRFIEFERYDGNGVISININKIVGVTKKNEDQTTIFVSCENESEEWIVGETYLDVLEKLRD